MKSLEYISRRFAREPSIVSRKIAGEFILVPIKQKAGEIESIYSMNEAAGRIWELIDGEKQAVEIRDAIIREFEVSMEEAETDLIEFLRQLEKHNFVKTV
ncbi:MAG: PqqD family protein [Nitrospirota bacterium]|nr:PqqD family protein [Nitrospirota bacterium]